MCDYPIHHGSNIGVAMVQIEEKELRDIFSWSSFRIKQEEYLRKKREQWGFDCANHYYDAGNRLVPYSYPEPRPMEPVISRAARPRKGDGVLLGDTVGGWICYIADGEAFVRTVDNPVPQPYSLDDFFDYKSKGRRTIWTL